MSPIHQLIEALKYGKEWAKYEIELAKWVAAQGEVSTQDGGGSNPPPPPPPPPGT